jgi:hypothetical protein
LGAVTGGEHALVLGSGLHAGGVQVVELCASWAALGDAEFQMEPSKAYAPRSLMSEAYTTYAGVDTMSRRVGMRALHNLQPLPTSNEVLLRFGNLIRYSESGGLLAS